MNGAGGGLRPMLTVRVRVAVDTKMKAVKLAVSMVLNAANRFCHIRTEVASTGLRVANLSCVCLFKTALA